MARLGGDEFAALAVDAEGHRDLNSLRRRIHDHLAPVPGGLDLGLSLGVATCGADSFCSLDELVGRADRDMYRDKRMRREVLGSELAQ